MKKRNKKEDTTAPKGVEVFIMALRKDTGRGRDSWEIRCEYGQTELGHWRRGVRRAKEELLTKRGSLGQETGQEVKGPKPG